MLLNLKHIIEDLVNRKKNKPFKHKHNKSKKVVVKKNLIIQQQNEKENNYY